MRTDRPERFSGQVVGLTAVQGGRALVSDGKAITIYLDPIPVSGGRRLGGLIASGAYVVSDGLLESKAQWFVYYRPDMQD